MTAALTMSDVTVALDDGTPVIEAIDLTCRPGEIVGVVGESGSGKTTLALAALGYARQGAAIATGSVEVAGHCLDGLSETELRRLRGTVVSYVPQDPGSAMNPARRIGDALRDMRRLHGASADDAEIGLALERLDLPSGTEFTARYPHQLSGGQQQRVTIATALTLEPPLVVLDEPTTGLDVVTQALILDEIVRMRNDLGVGMIYVTHDLGVVSRIATRVVVMYAGRIVEEGPTEQVLHSPRHPYTAGLVASVPDLHSPREVQGIAGQAPGPGEWPGGCAFAPRCELRLDACEAGVPRLLALSHGRTARCLRPDDVRASVTAARAIRGTASGAQPPVLEVEGLRAVHRTHRDEVVAADSISFALKRGSCMALVGESGSGKTTIARCVAGLHARAAGTVRLEGTPLAALVRNRTREQRGRLQMVFQNPAEALNPRQLVGEQIARPARTLRHLSRAAATAEARELVDRVRLADRCLGRYPSELSGGERQRVGIARALAADPEVIVCDEITSALDVSVQAVVLELLGDLQRDLGLTLLFITHDLGVVASIADEVTVLENGQARERGPVGRVLTEPRHDYTRRLLDAAPSLDPSQAEPGVDAIRASTPAGLEPAR